ncbi:MAG: hypothetical protein RIR11_3591, partial [Bacteroidota bacterium]
MLDIAPRWGLESRYKTNMEIVG